MDTVAASALAPDSGSQSSIRRATNFRVSRDMRAASQNGNVVSIGQTPLTKFRPVVR